MVGWLAKCLLGLLVGFAAFFSTFNQAFAQPEPRVVRVGIYDNPPKIFVEADGTVTGVYGDIIEYIAKQENWQLHYVSGSFQDGLNRLLAGEIDLMVDVAVTQEREKSYDFNHENVLSSWGAVYVQRGSSIRSFADLDGKTVAILRSSVYVGGPEGVDRYVRAFELDINFVELSEYGEVFDQLSRGQVDAAIVSRISGLEAERTYPNIMATEIIFSPTELRFALIKGDADNAYLTQRLDFWLRRLHEGHDGVYREILERHNLLTAAAQVPVIPSWVLPVLIAGGTTLLFSWFLTLVFRRARQLSDVRYRSIVSSMEEGVIFRNRRGEIIAINPSAERILGVSAAYLIGKSFEDQVSEAKMIREDGSPFSAETHPDRITLHTGKPQRNVVIGVYRPDGSLVWITVNSQPLLGRQAKPGAVVSTFRDITESRKLEQHRAEIDELKTKFIRIVSHQLRTPLGIIRWNLEAILDSLPKGISDHQKELLFISYREDVKIITRLNDLLEIMNIEEQKLDLKLETVDLEEIIRAAFKQNQPVAKSRQIELNLVTPEPALPSIQADREKIRSVVRRFIDNAITYTPDNGTVEVRCFKKDGKVRFEVSDSGIGIPSEEQHSVFERFFRSQRAGLIQPNSFGLSLFLAKNYIEGHGGTIGFTSQENEGSTFWFELPVPA